MPFSTKKTSSRIKGKGVSYQRTNSLIFGKTEVIDYSWKNASGYRFYFDNMLFPVTPSSLKIKIKNKNKTLTLINEGEINLLKQAGLTSISFSALLPNTMSYPFAQYNTIPGLGLYQVAKYYLEKLEELKNSRKPFSFRVIREGPGLKKLLFNSSFTVSLEDYTIMEDAEQYGQDVMVSITLLQYRAYGSKVLTINSETGTATATTTRDTSTKKAVTEYTVVQGDTLIKISQKTLGDGSRWEEIYTLNKAAIEQNAKDHGLASSSNGARIDPGLVLKIPG